MESMNNSMISIQYIPIFQDNYIWLIINTSQNRVIAVDPGDAMPLVNYLTENKLQLEAILITHHHFDHTNGIKALTDYYAVDVYGPKHEIIQGVTHGVSEPDTISFSFLAPPFTVLDIPGHTLHHIAYWLPGLLFCGDTLFSAGCGRIFEGTVEQMYHSLQKIAALPDATKIFCTHEYTLKNLKFAQLVEPHNEKIQLKIQNAITMRNENRPTLPVLIGEEKEINPFLRCHIEEIIQSVEKHTGLTLNNPLEVFKYLREWKNGF
jgi:hydroxyacylglutathione hydrolase